MTKKQTLSVTLATFNEEAYIGKCLSCIKDLASEIIIVDGSSTDKTAQIAKTFTDKVFKTTNKPNFHINKHMANKKAKGDWILQLDADEFVTPELKKEIKSLLSGKTFGFDSWISPLKQTINNKFFPIFRVPKPLNTPAAAYYLKRKNFFIGYRLKNCGQYPDPVIRLFQRGKALLPAKNVHEQMHVYGRTGWLSSDLDHHATPNFKRYLLRENRYSSLQAENFYRQGLNITILNTINYLFIKPFWTFFLIYFRYRGFLDGFSGFVFAAYSGLHHTFSYMKLWEIYQSKKNATT